MADADYLAVVGRGGGLLHLRGEEVGESLAGEPVDVVDGVPLPEKWRKHLAKASLELLQR